MSCICVNIVSYVRRGL